MRPAWKTIVASSLLSVAALRKPGFACDVCSRVLPHRTGSFELRLSTESSAFRSGAPVVVHIRLTNRGNRDMVVNLTQTVSQVSVRIVSDRFKSSQADVPVITAGGRTIRPGESATFAPRALQRWPNAYISHAGKYEIEVSYDGVDSNPISFAVVR